MSFTLRKNILLFFYLDMTMESSQNYSVDSFTIHVSFLYLFLFQISVLGSFFFGTELEKAFFVGERGRSVHNRYGM